MESCERVIVADLPIGPCNEGIRELLAAAEKHR